jgi:hypothetical protein
MSFHNFRAFVYVSFSYGVMFMYTVLYTLLTQKTEVFLERPR